MRFLTLSLALAPLLLLAVPTGAATNVVACTTTFAGDQYFTTGDYLFGHGETDRYAQETGTNAETYALCMPSPGTGCETVLAGDQGQATKDYLDHGQLNQYGGETEANVVAYFYCKGFT